MREAVFLLILIAGVLTASAELSSSQDRVLTAPGILQLNGEIDEKWLFSLKEAQSKGSLKEVWLNSGGGNIKVATEIAQHIRSWGITTRLQHSSDWCASACVIVFLGGTTRLAHPEAEFLFHGANSGLDGSLGNYGRFCIPHPIDGCEDLAEAVREKSLQSTLEAFAILESFGLSSELRKTFFARKQDTRWRENGNPLQITEWKGPAQEFKGFHLLTSEN